MLLLRDIAKEVGAEFTEDRNFIYAGDERIIREEYEAMKKLGIEPLEFYDKEKLKRSKLASEYYEAAILGPADWVQPYQLVTGLARAVTAMGAQIFEKSNVTKVKDSTPNIVKVNGLELVAGQVILATNAHTPRLGFFNNRVLPMQVGAAVTEKLPAKAIESLKWKNREIIVEANVFKGCTIQLTKDDRIFIRGTIDYEYGDGLPELNMQEIEDELLKRLLNRFPQLAFVKFEYKWTGAICCTIDSHPMLGKLDLEGSTLLYALGYNGHGIAKSIMYGKLLSELYFSDESTNLQYALKHKLSPWTGPPLFKYIGYVILSRIASNKNSVDIPRYFPFYFYLFSFMIVGLLLIYKFLM